MLARLLAAIRRAPGGGWAARLTRTRRRLQPGAGPGNAPASRAATVLRRRTQMHWFAVDPRGRINLFRFKSRVMAGAIAVLAVCGASALPVASAGSAGLAASGFPPPVPAVSDYQLLTASITPPTEAQCFAVGRRCFTP